MSPAALWRSPLALSISPFSRRRSLPVALPTPSLTAPLALSAAHFTCSLFITSSSISNFVRTQNIDRTILFLSVGRGEGAISNDQRPLLEFVSCERPCYRRREALVLESS